MRLGLGSYAYRWSIGIGDRIPLRPLTPTDLARRAHRHGLSVVQIADNLPLESYITGVSDIEARTKLVFFDSFPPEVQGIMKKKAVDRAFGGN